METFVYMIREIFHRVLYLQNSDFLGIDNPILNWKLHFKSTSTKICKKKFASFGSGSEFRPGAFANTCSKIHIGKNVTLRPGSFLYADPRPQGGSIFIEDGVLLGPNVHIYTNNHEFSKGNLMIIDQGYPMAKVSDSVILRRGCWIGAGSIILPGVEVGENSVVGAGSVVTKSIPSRMLFAGNPAREIRKLK